MLKLSPRWRKIGRDLWRNRIYSFILILSIVAGVAIIGTTFGVNIILNRELNEKYLAVNPAHIVIQMEEFDSDFVERIQNLPEIAQATGRHRLLVQIQTTADKKQNLFLIALSDYTAIPISQLASESGAWPPDEEAFLIERASLEFAQAQAGDTVLVETVTGRERALQLTGIVHDLNESPAIFSGIGVGYITLDTLEKLAQTRQFNELHLTVTPQPGVEPSLAYYQQVAQVVQEEVEASNRAIFRTRIPQPNEHPQAQFVAPISIIFASIGTLLLLMSVLLVINIISAILLQQVRYIGVMKSLGAKPGQIFSLYSGMILIISLIALIIALPLGTLVGRLMADYLAGLINVDATDYSLPIRVYIWQILIGLGVPLLGAFYPVLRGTQITIREAISNYQLGSGNFGNNLIDRLLSLLRGVSRPILISLRNTFRRKGRFLLTLSPLVLGGAIFITTLSIQASLNQTLNSIALYANYDIEINLTSSRSIRHVEREAFRIPGVTDVEGWRTTLATRLRDDGSESTELTVIGVTNGTTLIQPTVFEGRWLVPEDENAVVINSEVLDEAVDITPGDEITLTIADEASTWTVVGVVSSQLAGPLLYANYDYLTQVTGGLNQANRFAITTRNHHAEFQNRVLQALQNHFKERGLQISTSRTAESERERLKAQFDILIVVLLVIVTLLAFMGTLGLTGTLSINVIERIREIAVMRSIGASNLTLLRMILIEGILVGVLSWGLATPLALLISGPLSNAIGFAFARGPLQYIFPLQGVFLWFVIVIILSALASFIPAWNVSRINIKDALAYE